jgi:hypothetical protein
MSNVRPLMTRPKFTQPWAYAVALAGVLGAAVLGVYTDTVSARDLLVPALSLVGTFFGATFAFRLNQDKEARKLADEQREALNRASFILIRQWNAMDQLVRQFQAYPPPFERAFNMPAFKPPSYTDLSHTIADLDFLIDSSNPGLLMQLVVEQETFHQALESLRIRNDFYVTEVQPALEKLRVNGTTVSAQQMAEALGERLFQGSINGAETAWQLIHSASESIPKVHQALLAEARNLFPGRKFITYERAA